MSFNPVIKHSRTATTSFYAHSQCTSYFTPFRLIIIHRRCAWDPTFEPLPLRPCTLARTMPLETRGMRSNGLAWCSVGHPGRSGGANPRPALFVHIRSTHVAISSRFSRPPSPQPVPIPISRTFRSLHARRIHPSALASLSFLFCVLCSVFCVVDSETVRLVCPPAAAAAATRLRFIFEFAFFLRRPLFLISYRSHKADLCSVTSLSFFRVGPFALLLFCFLVPSLGFVALQVVW